MADTSFAVLLQPAMLQALALGCVAAAVLIMAVAVGLRLHRQSRARQTVESALARRESVASGAPPRARPTDLLGRWLDQAVQFGGWVLARWGESILPDDEKRLIDVCGFRDLARARALYASVRVALPVLLPVLGWLIWGLWLRVGEGLMPVLLVAFFGFGFGWMLPKWLIQRRVAGRRKAVKEELPLLVDLLRLLQGVGLSVDQSLHVIVTDFRSVLPVLGFELSVAVERHARGVERGQSLRRMAKGFDNDDLAAIARLIVQVDEHGGAVQEPLRQFSERLREQRRMEFKERVGRLTVKMTGVMVLTLLPALLIVTAGAGFLALFRGLARVVVGG
ncbi:type II secretion system F family protein [Achromobacter sp. GG226]|uniref:type II secretion system F family protein n=1 Tax=Verticiella alkaliphila TaxID=2779529 RepID=UPI001C0C293D|nr:type II secretion system F family protein [Verticiella sp. GG226]MBU4613063.1 type II secretion system F family protein [Verticiella sp. GG226]